MHDNSSNNSKKRYLFVALGSAVVGAVAGGLFVAIATKALTKMMGAMRDMMRQ